MKDCCETDFIVSSEDVRKLFPEASNLGRKFFNDVWSPGGKELVLEAAKKNREKGFT